jgi:hypothetical protein
MKSLLAKNESVFLFAKEVLFLMTTTNIRLVTTTSTWFCHCNNCSDSWEPVAHAGNSTQDAEIKRIVVGSQPGQIVREILS